MKRAYLLITVILLGTTTAMAGDDPVPARFRLLEKSPGVKVLRTIGAGELPVAFTRVSAFTSDGKTGVYVDHAGASAESVGSSRILFWDVADSRYRKEIVVPGHVTALALSADGTKFLAGTLVEDAKKKATHAVTEWDAVVGKPTHVLGQHKDPIFTLAYSANEKLALSASWGHAKVWSMPKGLLHKEVVFPGTDELMTATFVANTDQLLCVVNNVLRLIDLDEKDSKKAAKGLFDLTGHENAIVSLTVSQDGKIAVSGSRDGTVRSWDLVQRKALHILKKNLPAGRAWISLAIADDSKSVLSCWSDDASESGAALLNYWDAATGKEQWSASGHYRGTVPIRIHGKHALVGGGCNMLARWHLSKGTIEQAWGGHKSAVVAICADRKGRLYSAGHDGSIHVWEAGKEVRTFSAHTEPIIALTLSPDESLLFTTSTDKSIKCWNLATGKLHQTLTGHTGSVSAVVIAKNGKRAYSGSLDRSIKIWDLETGKTVATLTGHADAVNCLALSGDEAWLASGSDDSTVRVWPITADRIDVARDIVVLEGHKKAITCLAFSPSNKTLLSGSQDFTVKVWDWSTGKAVKTLVGHGNWITSLAFADANSVMTTSDDLSVCRWDLDTAKETGRIDFGAIGDCPRCLAIAGPGRFVVGTSSWMLFELEMKSSK